jgi:hypothetical protein
MPATGQEVQFPPLERRGLRVLPAVVDRLVRSEFGEIDAGQPDIRTSAPCRQVHVLQMRLQGSEDWLYCAYFLEAKSAIRRSLAA